MIGPALLDVNVLVALFDPNHVHHETAHTWLGRHRSSSWATCPLTENGLVRVLSHPSYGPERISPSLVRERLLTFSESGQHLFWPDDLSFRDRSVFTERFVVTSRQLTDAYLLALAVRRGGCLATFDRTIPVEAVADATSAHVELIV